jgi:hypothetical protein
MPSIAKQYLCTRTLCAAVTFRLTTAWSLDCHRFVSGAVIDRLRSLRGDPVLSERQERCNLVRCFKALALGLLTCSVGVSQAEAGSLYVGWTDGTFINVTINGQNLEGAGGNFQPNTLDGTPLTYLYCVSAIIDIAPPGTFTSIVTTNGMVFGSPVTNAGEVSWLLTNLAPSATNGDLESGLQAAIWSVIYGNNFTLGANNPADVISSYNADLAALGSNTAPVSDLIWLSNFDSNNNEVQPFISLNPDPGPSWGGVPEPSSLVLAGTGLAIGALALLCRCRRRLAGPRVK